MLPAALAHQEAVQILRPMAAQMSGYAVVGHCRAHGNRASCPARIEGGWQTLHVMVRERMDEEGNLVYQLRDWRVDPTPEPDPAP